MTLAKARIINYDGNCSFIVLATVITIVNYDSHLFYSTGHSLHGDSFCRAFSIQGKSLNQCLISLSLNHTTDEVVVLSLGVGNPCSLSMLTY
jgi:hypothetical protein